MGKIGYQVNTIGISEAKAISFVLPIEYPKVGGNSIADKVGESRRYYRWKYPKSRCKTTDKVGEK